MDSQINNSLENIKQSIFKCRDEYLERRAEKERELDRLNRDIDKLIMSSDRQDRELDRLNRDMDKLIMSIDRIEERVSQIAE